MVEDEEEQFVYQPNFLGQYSSGRVQPKVSMGEAIGARFQESFFPKAIRLWNTPDFEQEVGFEPMADPLFADGGSLAQVKHKFAGARSQSELNYQLDRYYQEIENLRKINNSEADYGLGFLQDLAFDPITYVPLIGPWARGAKASHRAMASGSAAFAMTVPYEAVMRADSMTRTNAESAITLGAMFTIAGATGAAFGRKGRSFYPDLTETGTVTSPKRVKPTEGTRRDEPSAEMSNIRTGEAVTVRAWRGQTDEALEGNASRFVPPGENAQYWAFNKGQASTYSDDVIEADLKLNNPVVINNDLDFIDFIKRATGKELTSEELPVFFMGNAGRISFEQLAKAAGHDSIIIRLWTKSNDDVIESVRKQREKALDEGSDLDFIDDVSSGAAKDNQDLRAMFDQNEIIIFDDVRFEAPTGKPEPKAKSMGAAAPVDPEDLARQESLRPTGTGLESVPLTPIVRLLDSKDPYTVGVATDLTETSGMILNKIDDQIPMTNDSVTVKFRTTYLKPLHDAIEAADNAFLKFRGATPSSTSALSNSAKMATLRTQELGSRMIARFRGQELRTRNNLRLEFNKRVGLALMRGGDNVDDSMSPFVNEAAKSYRQVLDLVRRQGEQVGLFAKEFEKQLAKLRKDPDGNAPAIRRLESKIANLRSMGAAATINSKGYFPRIYDVDYLLSNEGRSQWFRTLAPVVGNDTAQSAYNKITNSFDDTIEGFEGLLEDVAAGASKARMLDVDDELLVPFLDFNVEAVVRDHVRRMGMDIELTRKFGSISMDDIIDRLPTAQAKRDVTALRDIIRGTYGRPSDPYSHLNRGITLLKNFSPLVYMGGAAVSSLPDIARPIMTEGINAFAGTMLKKFRSQNREIIKQMNRKMVREVGEALDMTLSMRAFAMADIGSTFGRQSRIERTIKDLQAPFFLLNGLNIWNTVMKEFAGLTISQRMFRAMRTDWQKLNKADKERLLANGIDGPMAARINAMMNVEGFSTKVDGMVFPELGKWTDTGAADTFKRALNQQINRTIVTPDVGDRALWTQTHVGSMIAQFKSFGQASTNRVLISGLQERNANFYIGAIAMTSLGILVNEIKDFQYGSTKERTWGQVLSDGIDRAGLLAIFADINHALETVSSNRVGLDALAGGQPKNYGGVRRTIGEFGPSASILYDFGNMVSETFQGEAFSKSFMGSMRRTTPYMSHPLFPGFLYE